MQPTDFRTGVISPIECVKEGFDRIKSDYWMLFAISLVGALIGGCTLYVLFGAMACGMFYAFLKKIDGYPVIFDDLWKGMNYFLPGLIVTLVVVIPLFVYYIAAYISFIGAIVAGAQLGEAGMLVSLFGVLGIDIVVMVLLVCFHTLIMFSFPLIVDRNLGAIAAMKTSARAVWKNLAGVAGLAGVNMVLIFIGMAVCIGTYFVIPILIAGNVVAYRRVFPPLNLHGGNQFR